MPNPNERILYVDDERESRNAFADAAAELGFRVDTADGGGEALTKASRRRYAVIAADLRMPTLNGLSLIQLLRPKRPEASYLIVTGVSHIDLPAASDGQPLVDGVVSKPWSLDDLARTLGVALDRHRDRRGSGGREATASRPLLVVHEDAKQVDELRAIVAGSDFPFELRHAGSLEAVTELAAESSDHVALLDLECPRAGGLAGVRALRGRLPEAPLLVVGDRDDERLAARVLAAGAQDYLVKSRLDAYHLRRSLRYAVERMGAERRLTFLQSHDPVTGLPNRAAMRRHLEESIRSRRPDDPFAVLLLDLDRFHAVNDSLGHDVGDGLLKVIAQRLSQNLRDVDTVARIGGDEFAIVLESSSTRKEVVDTAQRLLESLVPPVRLGDYEIAATGSIGVAVYPAHGKSAVELLQQADKAMYRAKANGRDGFEIYSTDEDESRSGVLERLRFESGVRHALERDEYVVHYQPQASLDRDRLMAVEALIRWRHPKVGLVPPGRFMPFLESSGLIRGVGEWVLETSCRQVKLWQRSGFTDLRLSVNLSARQFEAGDLVGTVERILRETTFPSELLELEITESLLVRDTTRTRAILDDLKSLGVRIAIDDFGTGHSSLAYLTRFPLDCLKIDRSFVRDITTDEDDRTVAEAIIGLGHNLRLDVVAEGVETEEQLALLRGCDGFQGYLFSRPQAADEVASLLGRHHRGFDPTKAVF